MTVPTLISLDGFLATAPQLNIKDTGFPVLTIVLPPSVETL